MTDLPHLASMLYGTPLMMSPAKLDAVLAVLEPRLAGTMKFPPSERKPPACQVTEAGIAILPVTGTLVRRASLMSAECGMSSYAWIEEAAEDAFTDPAVAGVLLDIDSCGGEAAGLFDLVDALRSMSASAGKPLWAHANENALSAAYGIACSAEKIWVAQTALAGSVGVVALHVDQSQADAGAGLKYTYVFSGAKKTEGNPHEPLTDAARDSLQADVDALYGKFCAMVAGARRLSTEAVRGTEAQICRGADAVAIGFADRVGTLRQAHDALAEHIHQNMAASGRLFHALEGAMNEEKAMENVPQAEASPALEGAGLEQLRAQAEAEATARLAELSAIAAQAKRLGVDIDPVEAMKAGIRPDGLRRQVLEQAAAKDAAADIVAVAAPADAPKNDNRLLEAVKKLNGGV